jgi:hypothetical protein
LIWSPKLYLVRSTDHKPPWYVVFSTPLLHRHSIPKHVPQLCLFSSLNVSDQVSQPYETVLRIYNLKAQASCLNRWCR